MPKRDGRPFRDRLRRAMAPAVISSRVMTVAILGVVLISPAGHNAGRLAIRVAAALSILPRHAQGPPADASARPFRGTPAVGALFTRSRAGLGNHFCTASVVHSRREDVLI